MDFSLRVIRSKRKTISIHILPDGGVEVRCPQHVPDTEIEKIIKKHSSWIQKKQTSLAKHPPFHGRLHEGCEIFYLGHPYPLIFADVKQPVWTQKEILFPRNQHHEIQKSLENWYKKQARDLFTERLNLYCTAHGFTYKGLRISSAKKRYGSCSAKNQISLSWRLIFFPIELIDYVVVHELVHTREKHHQKNFWKVVATILPDYKEREKKLKERPLSSYWS
ncbi:M48 family metallopeptidase [Thermospira aquatica]|uniref:M48 family metallopeptidase n=1 Tax=Thermospira aquatica TaxID=2828656 RepID=A0AAX3BEN2_9SPIR|nr:SprT family zinc-dependent metalloprotease [Thermospira aquatica]URA10568.1 M48 family metallopeptidase [Thermospira aquatica]